MRQSSIVHGPPHTVMRGLFLQFNLSRMDVPVLITVEIDLFRGLASFPAEFFCC